MQKMREKTAADGYETCILCGKKTYVKRIEYVNTRNYYVAGCGQLCAKCWRNIYRSDKQVVSAR